MYPLSSKVDPLQLFPTAPSAKPPWSPAAAAAAPPPSPCAVPLLPSKGRIISTSLSGLKVTPTWKITATSSSSDSVKPTQVSRQGSTNACDQAMGVE